MQRNNVLWCEISQEESDPILEIYPHPTGKPWTFPFAEAFACLQHAARKLVGPDEPVPEPSSFVVKQVAQKAANPEVRA
ncbi:hypothetical protein HYR99_38850 [Candidatus Poribacteria bacterium]|nr:hypothetical protein [Candidatus Poribacteria bacterium]